MNDEPLIYTSKGNVPVASLTYEPAWEHAPGNYLKFVERYRDASRVRSSEDPPTSKF